MAKLCSACERAILEDGARRAFARKAADAAAWVRTGSAKVEVRHGRARSESSLVDLPRKQLTVKDVAADQAEARF